jgi:hypothetical protein
MSFSLPFFQTVGFVPYEEASFHIQGKRSFAIKCPWLEIRGSVEDGQNLDLSLIGEHWHNLASGVVSEFLSSLYHWPICYLKDDIVQSVEDSMSPLAAFTVLRRDYLKERIDLWSVIHEQRLDTKKIFATHYHFLKGSDVVLNVALHKYGKIHESIRAFRDQEFGHWRLVGADIERFNLLEVKPSKHLDALLSRFTSGVCESYFNFCMFLGLCEGTLTKAADGEDHSVLANIVESSLGLQGAVGLRLHSKINRDLNHEAAVFDFLSYGEPLSRSEFLKAKVFLLEVARLQNLVLMDLIELKRDTRLS